MFQNQTQSSKTLLTDNSTKYKFRTFKTTINRNLSNYPQKHNSLIIYNPKKIIKSCKKPSFCQEQNRQVNFINSSSMDQPNSSTRTFLTFMKRQHLLRWNQENKQNEFRQKIINEFVDSHQCKESSFTFLDSMMKPYHFLDNSYQGASTELKKQKNDLVLLRVSLNQISSHVCQDLKDIQETMRSKMKELQSIFINHKISEQELKMRTKRQVSLLSNASRLNVQMMKNLQGRNIQIQQKIFNCHPFELQFKDFQQQPCQKDSS